jgi:hypothetical protein
MHLKKAYDMLLGRLKEPCNMTKQSLQNLSEIVDPIAKDNGTVVSQRFL